jgi:hypothetical protein
MALIRESGNCGRLIDKKTEGNSCDRVPLNSQTPALFPRDLCKVHLNKTYTIANTVVTAQYITILSDTVAYSCYGFLSIPMKTKIIFCPLSGVAYL